MAQSISTISESPLVGSPTVMQVVPENYAENRTFHRSVLRVYAGLENGDFTDFDFSNPVETKIVNGSVITLPSEFNISSALKAVADRYEYSVNPPEKYPYIKFRVEAWDEYMIDGNTYKTGTQLWPGYYFPYLSKLQWNAQTCLEAIHRPDHTEDNNLPLLFLTSKGNFPWRFQ